MDPIWINYGLVVELVSNTRLSTEVSSILINRAFWLVRNQDYQGLDKIKLLLQ